MKRLFLVLLGLLISIPGYGQTKQKQLIIVSTLFPTYDFACQIAQDKAKISLLLPQGMEAHTYEPKPSDMERINHADILIFTNQYMEPWLNKVVSGAAGKKLTVVDSSQGIDFFKSKDPHVWLDLANAQIMVDNICQAMTQKDPDNAAFYQENAAIYKQKLKILDEKIKNTLSGCKQKTLLYGGHFTFGYFSHRYGLEFISPYSGFSPSSEPSVRAIAELIKKLRSTNSKVIYYEELIEPKVAKIIAQETKAKMVLLSGGHNLTYQQFKDKVSFLEIMEDNLDKLAQNLQCQ